MPHVFNLRSSVIKTTTRKQGINRSPLVSALRRNHRSEKEQEEGNE